MNATTTASEYGVPADQNRWLGIDFSGDKRKWSAGCSKSNVWIADIRPLNDMVRLVDLRRVRELGGDGSPFELLAGLLAKRAFLTAAIDAPFSVPNDFLPNGSHKALLEVVAKLSRKTPFPDAQTFADSVTEGRRMAVPKPLRKTERMWQKKGLNVRSTLWTGARGGAAMTAVCLSLLAKAACPMWPWSKNGPGLLAEAFPAAQLLQWKLPCERYNYSDETSTSNRSKIVSFLENGRLEIGEFKPSLLTSADALDSVLCAFAAKAVWNRRLVADVEAIDEEGEIAVHQ
jgi:Protein of unknown function (DUF429)